ncbi:MAG: HpcH/HpaI aldolase/citrate lyase family protein [Clostridium sp.]|uniref:HpcH/HpaI aldolase/citrate lyase family protein n=1 Tax=Clostridium sp. TaxID=1506 RepID=UPI003F34BAA9
MEVLLESKWDDIFYKKPKSFNKYSDKRLLAYSLGTNLYMNGFKNFYQKIVDGEFNELGAISICFEDATCESDLKICTENVFYMLGELVKWREKNSDRRLPLMFIRVRNLEQFESFTREIDKESLRLITGFTFPKFSKNNGQAYFDILNKVSKENNEIFYAMPIIETKEVIYKETRLEELIKIKEIIDRNKEKILNIRVGGTDFSSKFALRRSKEKSIYDIRVVMDVLVDILNMFGRAEADYVLSAAVWEYFSLDKNSEEIKGLINEIKLDKENGFIGKTIIHPLQAKYINALYAVTYEEFLDAKEILGKKDGVFKGYGDNKMNEVKPHTAWAKEILKKAEVFGVLNEGYTYENLL